VDVNILDTKSQCRSSVVIDSSSISLLGLKKIFASEGALRGLFTGAGTRMLFQAPTTVRGMLTNRLPYV